MNEWSQLQLNVLAVSTCSTDIGTNNHADTDTDCVDTVVQPSAVDSTRQDGFQADQEKEGSEEECKASRYFSGQASHV